MTKRTILAIPILGSLTILALLTALGLIKLGRSPEYAIVLSTILIMPTLILVSGWITWGLRRDD